MKEFTPDVKIAVKNIKMKYHGIFLALLSKLQTKKDDRLFRNIIIIKSLPK